MSILIDSHTHTQFAAYKNNRDEVIAHALKNNIWMINVGTQSNTSKAAVELAKKYTEGVYATIGLHPIHTHSSYHDPQELEPAPEAQENAKGFQSRAEAFDYDFYKMLGENKKVVGIGECGLDYYHVTQKNGKPLDKLGADNLEEIIKKQKEVFLGHLMLAKEMNKPLMIHCRDAYDDVIKMLKSAGPFPARGNIHFFVGNYEIAKQFFDLGFTISIGGVITFTRAYDELYKKAPLDMILLETDAPYVSPEPMRGKTNEPAFTRYVAEALAKIKATDFETVAMVTTANTKKMFRI